MIYSSVEVVNSTNYPISGEISYMTVFCSDTDFTVEPNSKWESEKRICPIVEILAFVVTPKGVFYAKPFVSIGTTHTLFEVIQTGDFEFRVVKMRNIKNNFPFLQTAI